MNSHPFAISKVFHVARAPYLNPVAESEGQVELAIVCNHPGIWVVNIADGCVRHRSFRKCILWAQFELYPQNE